MALRNRRLGHSIATACEQGASCSHYGDGHQLAPAQRERSLESSDGWIDGVISDVTAQGWLALVDFTDAVHVVWQHADLLSALEIGTLVAFNPQHQVLAVDGQFLSATPAT